jgi:hypothetical protein
LTRPTTDRVRRAGAAAAVALTLGVIAAFASPQRLPDSFYYERIAAQKILPRCGDLHCFRPLVPWVLGLLPPSVAKWKTYAVICNTGAAFAVFDLCLAFGVSIRAATIALLLSAFGFGSLYTLFEPFTADPLMFWLAPVITRWLLEDHVARAGALACLGVCAKEFVVAPVVMVALAAAGERRWTAAARIASAAAIAFAVWLALQYWFIHHFGYSYGNNPSTQLASGGYLLFWLRHQSARASAAAQFVEFGALYLLIPFGFTRAPRTLRQLTIAAIPIACVFAYVQQPDRALWNFHFLTSPLSALVLERLPNAIVAAFLFSFGLAYLRVGAQITAVPEARYAMAVTIAIALFALVANRRPAFAT